MLARPGCPRSAGTPVIQGYVLTPPLLAHGQHKAGGLLNFLPFLFRFSPFDSVVTLRDHVSPALLLPLPKAGKSRDSLLARLHVHL